MNYELNELIENADSEIYKKQKSSLARSREANG
jgi:hypothetical protein